MSVFTALWKDESGQALVEYGAVIALAVAGAVLVMGMFGTEIKNLFTNVAKEFNKIPGSGTGS